MENDITIKKPTYSFAKRQGIVVSDILENKINVFHTPEASLESLAEVSRLYDENINWKEVDAQEFQQKLAQVYQSTSTIEDAALGMEDDIDITNLAELIPKSEDLLDSQDDAPIIRLINALFTQAIKHKASDIHIETYERRVIVRNRIDGVLQEVLEIQRAIAPLVISRVKVMAKLDIAEKRVPQDGRISLRIGGHNVDVRVSTLPSTHGERIVLRILDKEAAQLNLSLLGIPKDILTKTMHLINQPHGIILVTGPTGSGKTTSLYAMLTELNKVTRNILTIEDPIEYDLPGIGQTQVNTKVEMTFAKGLRAILRQDPDVVMIGEIRDLETAEISVQASLTGHLVLSTLHTNTALGAINRLKDMGVEPFLLSSSLIGLMAQRLVRVLCPECKQKHKPRSDEKELLNLSPQSRKEIYEPKGCNMCNQTGYRGRTGIYELITIDEEMRGMIHRNESFQTIKKHIRQNCPGIRTNGFQKVLEGKTSVSEVLRVTSQD